MFIRQIEIDGVEENVTVTHTDQGADVTASGRLLFQVGRYEDRESRYAKALIAAGLILGRDRKGQVAGTNSMIHEVLTEIERVAGC